MGTVTAESERTPLARLFAVGYRTLIENLRVELRSRGWTDHRPRVRLRPPRRSREDRRKRPGDIDGHDQASKTVEAGGRRAWSSPATSNGRPGSPDGRRKEIGLTERGQALLVAVESIYRDLERRWAVVVGEDRVERLRTDLEALLLDPATGRLPPSPAALVNRAARCQPDANPMPTRPRCGRTRRSSKPSTGDDDDHR